MKDLVGNPITPGVLLAYPGRQTSSVWTNVMRVVSVDELRISGTRIAPDWGAVGKPVSITGPGMRRAVVVREPDTVVTEGVQEQGGENS